MDIILKEQWCYPFLLQEPWLARVDPNNLKINLVAYFGEIRLQSHTSVLPSHVVSTSQDTYGNTIYQVKFDSLSCIANTNSDTQNFTLFDLKS